MVTEHGSKVTVQRLPRGGTWLISLLAIVIISFCLRTWYAFSVNHCRTYAIGDAYEYLNDAQSIQRLPQLFRKLAPNVLPIIASNALPSVVLQTQQLMQPLTGLSASGPIFPTFLFLSYRFFGNGFNLNNPLPPVLLQCFLSSLTAVLIAIIGRRAFGFTVGCTSGILAAFYPPFIINAGQLSTETFACFLLCVAAYATMKGSSLQHRSYAYCTLAGLSSACLQLTRSVMFLATFISFVFLSLVRRKDKTLIPFVIGFMIIALPWCMWQKLALGKFSLIVDRNSSYNLYIGNNLSSYGWCPIPNDFNLEALTPSSAFRTLKTAVSPQPFKWMVLCLEKIVRLVKLPYDDFRGTIPPLSLQIQSLLHQILLLLALSGVSLALFEDSQRKGALQNRLYILSLIGFHLIYVLFIAMSRYALSAMPFIIIFSSATLVRINAGLRDPKTQKQTLLFSLSALLLLLFKPNTVMPLANIIAKQPTFVIIFVYCARTIVLALFGTLLIKSCQALCADKKRSQQISFCLLLALVPFFCMPLRVHGRFWESPISLEHVGQTVTQCINVPPNICNRSSQYQPFLIIDSDGFQNLQNGVEISINGQTLEAPVIPGLSLLDDPLKFEELDAHNLIHKYEYIFTSMDTGCVSDNAELRQWFLVPLPTQLLKPDMEIKFTKTTELPTKLFVGYKLGSAALRIASLTRYSYEKAFFSPESQGGISDPRFDEALEATGGIRDGSKETSRAQLLARILVEPSAKNKAPGERYPIVPITIDCLNSSPISKTCDVIKIPFAKLGRDFSAPYYLLRLKGSVSSSKQDARPGIGVRFRYTQGTNSAQTYESASAPKLMRIGIAAQSFDIALPITLTTTDRSLTEVELSFYSRSLLLSRTNVLDNHADVKFKDLSAQLIPLMQNPLTSKYQIF